MEKQVVSYTVEAHASMLSGVVTQILFNDSNNDFAGRIDFYRDAPVPSSYLWYPNGTSNDSLISLVLAMPYDMFAPILQMLKTINGWALFLQPSGPLTGVSNNGTGGELYSTIQQPVG